MANLDHFLDLVAALSLPVSARTLDFFRRVVIRDGLDCLVPFRCIRLSAFNIGLAAFLVVEVDDVHGWNVG